MYAIFMPTQANLANLPHGAQMCHTLGNAANMMPKRKLLIYLNSRCGMALAYGVGRGNHAIQPKTPQVGVITWRFYHGRS